MFSRFVMNAAELEDGRDVARLGLLIELLDGPFEKIDLGFAVLRQRAFDGEASAREASAVRGADRDDVDDHPLVPEAPEGHVSPSTRKRESNGIPR